MTSAANGDPILIAGAGITGLTLGMLLARRGLPVILVEKEASVGGLARSFKFDDFTFDAGPHRFHTHAPEVERTVREILGAGALEIPRNSQVHFMDHYYPWPLTPGHLLLHFPPRIALSILRDLLTLYRKRETITFRDHIENMYGPTLYRSFFEEYSSKFLGIVPELTDPDWAKTGIDRAIIDQRLQMHSLKQLLLGTFLPGKKPETRFIYPAGGCGGFPDAVASQILESGGEIITGKVIDEIETTGGRILSARVGGRLIKPSLLVWTAGIHDLARLLGLAAPSLDYLSLVCYNLRLTEGERFSFQWCYHGAPDIFFSRVSIPSNFSADNVPEGCRSFCVEVPCDKSDDVYRQPERFMDRVIHDMKKVGLLKIDGEITGFDITRFDQAYPVYKLGYRVELEAYMETLSRYANLRSAGRLGRFWYNNMDHCISESLRLADEIYAESAGAAATAATGREA